MSWGSYYRMAVLSPVAVRGDATDNSDLLAKAKKALDLLDSALVRAQGLISGETESVWAKVKAAVTGVNLGAAQGEVKSLALSVQRMHDAFSKFDASTTDAKLKDFILACAQLSDLSTLQESLERNQLLTLVKEVGAETGKELVKDAGKAAEAGGSFLGNVWGSLPWWGKVLVVGVPVLAVYSGVKRKVEDY